MAQTKIALSPPAAIDRAASSTDKHIGSSRRATLRAAMAAVPGKVQAAQEAAECAERAKGLVDAAQAALENFADLDERVQRFLSATIRHGATVVAPAIPPDLVDAKRSRMLAAEFLADAIKAAQTAASDAQAAAEVVRVSREMVDVATIHVLREVAVEESVRLREIELHYARERARLASYADTFSFNDNKLKPVPGEISRLFQDPWHNQFTAPSSWQRGEFAAEWVAFRKALRDDPDAQFEPKV